VEQAWLVLGEVVLPILVGAIVLAVASRSRALASHPFASAVGLYVLLVVLSALAAPGGYVWMPAIGGVISIAVAVAVYAILRRRRRTASTQPAA
jgi:hypothetical protein